MFYDCPSSTIVEIWVPKCSTIAQVLRFLKLGLENVLRFSIFVLRLWSISPEAFYMTILDVLHEVLRYLRGGNIPETIWYTFSRSKLTLNFENLRSWISKGLSSIFEKSPKKKIDGPIFLAFSTELRRRLKILGTFQLIIL